MRLIDADKLIKRLRNDPLFEYTDQFGVLGVIEAEPTVDAQAEIDRLNRLGLTWYDTILKLMEMVNGTELKHGKWINCGYFDAGYAVNLKCECCGKIVSGRVHNYEYCPYCGARMDGGKHEID